MSAEELLRAGRLDEALDELTQQVKRDPADVRLRIFMFQLLTVLGQWSRAHNQLKVAGELDPAAMPMVQTYTDALGCEALRRKVFEGERSPLVFGDPEQWIALMMQALGLAAAGRGEEAARLRDEAFEQAPATSGTIDGQAFEWIADADARLGPLLEVVLNGRYYWVPFHRIRRIQIEAPVDLRDAVWTPAYFTWANGGQLVGLIPTRYAKSELAEDSALRLSRKTEWLERPGELFEGCGQRLLATDAGEFALMDTREIVLEVESETPEEASDGASGGSSSG